MMKNQWVEQAERSEREMDEKRAPLSEELYLIFVHYHLDINRHTLLEIPKDSRRRILHEILNERGDIDA